MDSSTPHPLTPELLAEHTSFLSGLAFQLVRDDHDAADIVQETFLSAVTRPPDERGAARSWLARVARNHALQSWRSRRRRRAREEWVARDEKVPSAADIVERENARRAVVEALVALSEPYRSALLLRFYEDLPPREVARRLGVPVETARTRIKRGLAQLRSELDRSFGADRRRWVTALLPLAASRVEGTALSGAWLLGAVASFAALTAFLVLRSDDPGRAHRLAGVPSAPLGSAVEGDDARSRDASETARRPADREVPAAREVLRVQVVGAEDGAPRSGVTVALEKDGRRLSSAVSDEAGRLELAHAFAGGLVLHADATDETLEGSRPLAPADERVAVLELALPGASSVSGTAVDERGSPLPGVHVVAYATRDARLAPDLDARALATARTDGAGRFALRGLPRRFYVHGESRDGFVALAGLAADLDGPLDAADVVLVLQRAWSATGRVLDDAGRGLPGAHVRSLAPDARGTGRASGIPGASWRALLGADVRADASGRFELRGLAPLAHVLSASCDGYVEDSVTVHADGAELEIVLRRAGELALTVAAGDGEPIAGARVELGSAAGRTDAAGTCSLPAVPGPSRLRVEAAGYASHSEEIELREGEAAARTVVLERARVLTGRVLEPDGSPSPRAIVVARAAGREVERAVADEGGRFELRALGAASSEGTLELRATAEGERAPRGFARDDGSAEVDLVLRGKLEAAVILRGRAIDAATREPLERFRVTARGKGGRVSAEGLQGAFELGAGDAGDWALSATAEGYAPWSAGSKPLARGEHELEIELWPAASATVRLVDRRGEAVEEARLLVEDDSGRPLAARIRDEWWSNVVPVGPRGEARLEGLPAREVFVRVRLPDLDPPQRFRVDLRERGGAARELRLELDRSSPTREIELALSGVPGESRFRVEVASGGEPCASFDALVAADGTTTVERPVRCLVLRFSGSGDLFARSSQTLAEDSLSRELGPRSAGAGTPRIRARVPAAACEIAVSAPGFQTRRLALAAGGDAAVEVALERSPP